MFVLFLFMNTSANNIYKFIPRTVCPPQLIVLLDIFNDVIIPTFLAILFFIVFRCSNKFLIYVSIYFMYDHLSNVTFKR